MCSRIDPDYIFAQPQVHAFFGPETNWSQKNSFKRLLAGKIFLRKRRALIGRLGIATDHRDRTVEFLLPQGDGNLRTAMSRSNNENVRVVWHLPVSYVI